MKKLFYLFFILIFGFTANASTVLYDMNGNFYKQDGDNIIGSNGVFYKQNGKVIIGSDGSICRNHDGILKCHKQNEQKDTYKNDYYDRNRYDNQNKKVFYDTGKGVTHGTDGVFYKQNGNMIYGSDGTFYKQNGDTIYGSNGVFYKKNGNVIIGSDGSICHNNKGKITCKKN